MNILQIKNLNISYKEKLILKDVNIDIKEREILCIMGASGSGKSTFLSSLNGFLDEIKGSFSGEILYKGKNITEIKKLDLRKNIATLFQDSTVFPFSIEKNLTYPMEFFEGKIKNKDEKIKELLKSVNLYDEIKDSLKMNANKLSGGQKQRLCIARMLTTNPEILIFDEPCSSLDENNTLFIEKLLKELKEKYTIILSTHNFNQAKRIADRILKIENKTLKK
ncbi:hypothetical protein HMPREF3188_00628 [Tissierellia bacterium KA00581]|jgi:hypothetical protein|nr:hypothetical protein HMPREF3188_00628 [Tissierellia bacterium KA00581]